MIIVLVGLVLPSKWQVQRSQIINAAPAQIYPYISNFKTGWGQWSTFDYEDPNIQYTYSGPAAGKGASRSWYSQKMGNGVQTITKADAKSGIEFELRMIPNSFSMTGEIKLEQLRNGTKVTWTDRGDVGSNIFFKYMGLMMDKAMGKTFEESLKNLQKLVEPKSKLAEPKNN
jgi:hypothetical protein